MADRPVSRRDFVKAAVVTASAAALGTGAFSAFIPALSGTESGPRPIVHRRPGGVEPVLLSNLDGPAPAIVVAEWNHQAAFLAKLPVEGLRRAAELRGYNTGQYAIQHPLEVDMALVGYEGRCTHLGCTVGFHAGLGASKDVADYDGDGVSDGRILCPCHHAQFDVYDLAANVSGTPAPRPLPVLVLDLGPASAGYPLRASAKKEQPTARAADAQGPGAPFRLTG